MKKVIIPIIVLFIAIALLLSSIYVVEQGTKGVVTRFNEVQTISEPGLHFRAPFMDKVLTVDTKTVTIENSTPRSGKGNFEIQNRYGLILNYYLQWKVADVEHFLQWQSSNRDVDSMLKKFVDDAITLNLKDVTIRDILGADNHDFQSNLLENVKNSLFKSQQFKTFIDESGIELAGIGIKQLDFPEADWNAMSSIYAEQQQNRETEAMSQLQEKIELEKSKAKSEAATIIANAEHQAIQLRREGDAAVESAYSKAYKKDKNFFLFFNSLTMYENSFNQNDILVIGPDSEFLRYMKLSTPRNN